MAQANYLFALHSQTSDLHARAVCIKLVRQKWFVCNEQYSAKIGDDISLQMKAESDYPGARVVIYSMSLMKKKKKGLLKQ